MATIAIDSDTVDGFHLDQDVRTTASPTFNSVTATTFIGNLTGSVDNADKVDGFDANARTVANTIPVRDASGLLPGDITGNAATATTATSAGNADTVEGYDMNQNVLTNSTPTFSGLNIGGSNVINSSGQWVGNDNPSYIRYCFFSYQGSDGVNHHASVALPNDETAWPDQFCCNYANRTMQQFPGLTYFAAYVRKINRDSSFETRGCTL